MAGMVSNFLWSVFWTNVLLSCFADFGCEAVSVVAGNGTDYLSLLQIKSKIIGDPHRVLSTWNTTSYFCQWRGVICGRRHQRVTVLNLSSLQLTGSISPHVGNLSFLRVFDLRNNSLSHIIPSEISHLRRLQRLSLGYNSIGGKIPPTISNCSNLDYIDVQRNHLVGEIPVELGSLSKLQLVALLYNNLTGSIPSSLGNLSFLEVLFLSHNKLDGSIPDAFGKLATLKHFVVSFNNLSGVIPPSFFNLSRMEWFYISENQIQGNLPFNMGITLPNLIDFVIFSNQFAGPIPISISNASNLITFEIHVNNFTGEVPSLGKLQRLKVVSMTMNKLGNGGMSDLSFICSLQNASNLEVLAINANYFGGILPECISNLSKDLAYLTLDNNKIVGGIPLGIDNLVNLGRFEMWNNQLSGNIPSAIGNLQMLVSVWLNSNQFSGNIPSSIGNLTMLSELYLQDNSLRGRIPTSLGSCQNLQSLNLSSNHLSGIIPPQVFDLTSLSIFLDLSQNRFTGVIPTSVGNLKNLGMLFFHQNMLDGKIPSSLSGCIRLEILNMHGNSFQGPIPESLSSLRGLQYLDISHNNISGQIPEFLATFSLLYLNLSFNNLEGPVPTGGVFKNASATSVTENIKLCGGIPEFNLPECDFHKSANGALRKAIVATLAAIFGAFLLVSVVLFLRFRKSNQRRHVPSPGNSNSTLSYKNLHDATNGFSSENLIGVGSFGSVYKGILGESEQLVAIKVFHLEHYGAAKSFVAECHALKNIRHRNLVKVLTACSSIDYQGNEFKALVYEFMVNGSLQEWLHPINRVDGNQEVAKNLSLSQRLSIAIDIASALEYLHHHCGTPIVHCDLKPSNVLLDNELTAHISDFGLAKFLLGCIHTCPNQSSSIGLRGTIGYAPPEYGLGQEISTWGDVYSYGILLLEIFTGKRPTADMFKDGWSLHEYAKSALSGRILSILDPILLQEVDESESSNNDTRSRNPRHIGIGRMKECLISIIGIGVGCSVEVPGERMKITDVSMKLSSIRNKLLENGLH